MQMLVLIRHAIAEERETWQGGDDAKRPLTDAGRKQAQHIAKAVMKKVETLDRGAAIVSLRSSPAQRCIDTVLPLSKKAGVAIDIDKGLMEGSEIKPPSPRADGVHIICAHGDNIPWLLDDLKIDWDDRCKKGSVWMIERDGRGRVVQAKYSTAPKD